jgi:two-component system, LytTR family, sensor kinase
MSTTLSKYKYWLFQASGWTFYLLGFIFFSYSLDKLTSSFVQRLLVSVALGLLLTHIMRWLILKFEFLQKSIEEQIVGFVVITAAFTVFYAILEVEISARMNLLGVNERKFSQLQRFIGNIFISFVTLMMWNVIYFVYHYVERNRRHQIDTLRLQAEVKELELKTIKSHINPHFIFNALNSIRALVDENPLRARTAITELSNILRSSMQAEKTETVTLEKELNIVRDYLALEHIRFEDRLRVNYQIDEDTLDQPVPPMMLQTLVENAIKHGISKQLNGGEVSVISDFVDNHHELIVRNTGHLNGEMSEDGFGLASTMNRIQLLYGEQGRFEIKNISVNMVEAKVILPVAQIEDKHISSDILKRK